MSSQKPRGPKVLFQHQLNKKRKRRKPSSPQRSELSVAQILAWADEYHELTGRWPTCKGGPVSASSNESWQALDIALRQGHRGLPPGSSLTRLLAEHRGMRNDKDPPRLTPQKILAWIDAHFQRTGEWPLGTSGPIVDAPGETWAAVQIALYRGTRGLPPGSSLGRFLVEHRGVYRCGTFPELTVEQILDWADAHHQRNGSWPNTDSGSVFESPSQTWGQIDSCLALGHRGLPPGSSLAKLLTRCRGVRNIKDLCRLSVAKILSWADAYHQRTGSWPTKHSGAIPEEPGETWRSINTALVSAGRGLRRSAGGSLLRLLAKHRGVRNLRELPPLRTADILAWADAHFLRTGRWPTQYTGSIPEAPEETWSGVGAALHKGRRGLPPSASLFVFLRAHGRKECENSGQEQ